MENQNVNQTISNLSQTLNAILNNSFTELGFTALLNVIKRDIKKSIVVINNEINNL